MEIPRMLVVTNDFPPRVGGIQRTLHSLVRELPPERVAVLAPRWEGSDAFDAAEPYAVYREPREFLWPTPEVRRRVREVVRETGAEVVLFGDAMPLAMLGPGLARRGVPYLVAAHGFDYWLSLAPGAHSSVRYMTSGAARVVMCSAFIARVVRTAVPDRVPVSVLYPGAEIERFRPDLPVEEIRLRHGVEDRPLVVCVSRLVARKGQDTLIRALPAIRRRVPDACLMLVGGGPYRERLERMARDAPPGSVVFAGQVSEEELPLYYAAGDVFAMPCRTRLGGLEVEG
ncbi:MAG: glycosyltransferase family 4 protein, partial [Actinobacteria bacterium]|nr:glycosyltransferase family 4 protein [Actinomycetota bacterium]